MRQCIIILGLFFTTNAFSQVPDKPLTKKIIVKTNLLSLVALRPTISVEKSFSKKVSVELSFVQGQFNNFLFTDHYGYNGFLVRVKKYFRDLGHRSVCPYVAGYAGNLVRHIETEGQSLVDGWVGYPSRKFNSNSLRFGGSGGLLFATKGGVIFDAQTSLGYGRYFNTKKPVIGKDSNGYLDVQVWLCVGYSF